MRPLALSAALVGLLSAAIPASGQKDKDAEHEIKIISPKTGDKIKVTVTEDIITKITIHLAGKNDVKTEYKIKKLVYEDEIINGQPNSRIPATVKRKYELATVGTGTEKDKIGTEPLSIQGKTVEVSNNGGPVYSYKVDKKNLNSGDGFDLLKSEFGGGNADLRDHMIPKKVFKQGESWDMKPGTPGPLAVTKELSKNPNDLQLNETAATISGKLIDIAKRTKEEKDSGKPITGKFEVNFTAPISQFGKDKGITVEQDSTFAVKLTADGCIDGKSPNGKLTTTMTLHVKGSVDGFKVDIDVTAIEDRKTELIPPEKKK